MSEQQSRAEYRPEAEGIVGPNPGERDTQHASILHHLRYLLAEANGYTEGYVEGLALGLSDRQDSGQAEGPSVEGATPDRRDTMIEYLREENRRLAAQAGDDWRKHTVALHLAQAKGMIEAAGDVYATLNRIVAAVGMLVEQD